MLTKSFFLFLKLEGYRVDAETLTRRRWAVIKDVSKVSATLFTQRFCSLHSKAVIHFFFDVILGTCPETGPACTWIKFCVWTKKFVSTSSANVNAVFLVFHILSSECRFGSLFSEHMIFFCGKKLLPLFFCFCFFCFDGFPTPWRFKVLKTELLPRRVGYKSYICCYFKSYTWTKKWWIWANSNILLPLRENIPEFLF